jgi:hypothetical protein
MAEDTQVDGEKTGETNSPSGERLMWKGTGRVAGNDGWWEEGRATRTKEER